MSETDDQAAVAACGARQAAEELLPLVYDELRRLATHRLAHEANTQTLQPTALVHEAWLRLRDSSAQGWEGRTHFFGAAAEAMRRILVEKARRRQRIKHGGGQERVELEEAQLAGPLPDDELLALDEALTQLTEVDPDAARLVSLRFFVGMTQAEAAEQLGVSRSTADRTWVFARAWLYRQLRFPIHPGEETRPSFRKS